MRLKYVYISDYKNLKDFQLSLDGESFIDVFVGKNGSGKSNLQEALIEIFRHLYEQRTPCDFEYEISYLIDDEEISIKWFQRKFFVNGRTTGTNTFSNMTLPENVLIYYSGHNETVSRLLTRYKENFGRQIKGAEIKESRRFIGIGPEYKSLLLSVLLCQENNCPAKNFISQKLGILEVEGNLNISLIRPRFAVSRLKELGYEEIEQFDARTHFWGADGITGEFLTRLVGCVKGEFDHSTIYDVNNDVYEIPVDIGLYQKEFSDLDISDQFRLFDNLKTLEMLSSTHVPVTMPLGQTNIPDNFSDGQFQSIYIYALTEIFKDKNCITLLDEPDSFLHPEWQSEFLKQVVEISDEATQKNHILLSSHSASTIAAADENTLRLFDLDGDKVVINQIDKSSVIRSLSAGLISFSESEAHLNINNLLKTTSGPVLFVEGITDEIILETAWDKLYPTTICPFAIQSAFDRHFLRNLFSREELAVENEGRLMFALFDFDEAYDDWNGLKPKKTTDVEANPHRGLAKQLICNDHIAMLLPVPNDEKIKSQVLDATGKPWGRGSDSYLAIELLFYRDEWVGEWFSIRDISGGGKIIEFSGDKVKFATDIVPGVGSETFEIFRPLFELMKLRTESEQPTAA